MVTSPPQILREAQRVDLHGAAAAAAAGFAGEFFLQGVEGGAGLAAPLRRGGELTALVGVELAGGVGLVDFLEGAHEFGEREAGGYFAGGVAKAEAGAEAKSEESWPSTLSTAPSICLAASEVRACRLAHRQAD